VKWYQVQKAVIAAVAADGVLSALYPTIRLMGSGDLKPKVLEYFLVGETETELWAPVTLQFDQWCGSAADLARSEQRLRRMFHLDLPATFDGVAMWCQYVDGEALAAPNRDGYFARAIRFRFTPLRDLYQPAPTP
jgi:hypothetical protein